MSILLVLTIALIVFLFSVDPTWSNVLSIQRNNLVFEGRNMAYGAYHMRREQPKNVMIALLVVLGLVGGGSATAMMMTRPDQPSDIIPESIFIIDNTLNFKKDEEKPEEEKPKEKAPVEERKAIENNEVEVTDKETKQDMKPVVDLENKNLGGKGDDDDFREPESNGGDGDEGGEEDGKEKIKEDEPVVPDVMPQFPGGEKELLKYMGSNVSYGAMDIEREVKGTIYLAFNVLPDGTIADIQVERGILNGENMAKKAIEAIRRMPKWKPGIKAGKPVTVRFRIPVKCTLEG